MAEKNIRIGIVGAGANTRARHIPGFRAIAGVEIAGVVNRTAESTALSAKEFGISKTYPDWRALVNDPEIDAVCIGTWPNLHCEVTLAALQAGKHVLTEARMARDAQEARRMAAAAQAAPSLVAQVVPSPFGLAQNKFVRDLIEAGFLGELRELVVIGADDAWWDYSKLLHWRQQEEKSGLNVMTLGILHETASRWVAATKRVFAQSKIFEPLRPDPESQERKPVTVPDSLQIVTQLEGDARGIYHFSGVTLFGPGKQIHLYGSRGTIKYHMEPREEMFCGYAGDTALRPLIVPPEKQERWRVEAEFIGAIRGEEKVRLNDFETSLRYMEFTDAVARSAATNLPVDL
jgi:predicted dehydrogenase